MRLQLCILWAGCDLDLQVGLEEVGYIPNMNHYEILKY
jgi:hypothetical protein